FGRHTLFALIVSVFSTVLLTNEAAAQVRPTIPVTVTNPNTNPAITSSIDTPGRAPYQSFNNQEGKCSGNSCIFTFTAQLKKGSYVFHVDNFSITSLPATHV